MNKKMTAGHKWYLRMVRKMMKAGDDEDVRRSRFILRIKKAARTPRAFLRQIERIDPDGDWRLIVSYRWTRHKKFELSEFGWGLDYEAESLSEILRMMKEEAEELISSVTETTSPEEDVDDK